MFIGHFGPATFFARQTVPLWHCFVAVQVIDYVFFPFVFLGIEQVSILPNATAVNHFHTGHIGYSHSLLSAIIFSVIALWIYPKINPAAGRGGAFLIAFLVFSHWLMDLIAHLPDLPVWPHGLNLGFGMWRYFWASIIVESALFLAGAVFYYVHNQHRATQWTVAALTLLCVTALVLVWVGFTGPVPSSVLSGLGPAPMVLLLLTAFAYLVDRSLIDQ